MRVLVCKYAIHQLRSTRDWGSYRVLVCSYCVLVCSYRVLVCSYRVLVCSYMQYISLETREGLSLSEIWGNFVQVANGQ